MEFDKTCGRSRAGQIGHWWIPSLKNFFFILEGYSNKPTALQRSKSKRSVVIFVPFLKLNFWRLVGVDWLINVTLNDISVIHVTALATDWPKLFFWNHLTEINKTWQEARSQNPLPRLRVIIIALSLCFSSWSDKQDGRPGLWLADKFLTTPLKLLKAIKQHCPLPSFCFSGGSIGKTIWPPGLWLAETFLISPLKLRKRIQRKLTGSKISTSSIKFVFFGLIRKTRWPPWPLIGWNIFSSETAERNSTKLDIKQYLDVLYQVCVFAGWSRWPLWPLICWDIFDFSSDTTEQNSTKLDRKQDLNVLY